MAIRIKKKAPQGSEDPLVDAPDQVLVATQETFGWLQDNRNLVIALVGGGVLAIIVAALVVEGSKSRRVAEAAPVLDAIAAATAPVGEGATYASVEDRRAAVAALAGEAGDHPVAQLLLAEARLADGDAEAASAALGRATSSLGALEGKVIAFGTASAQAEAGALDQALATLDHIASTDAALGPPALLHAARLTDAYGTPEAALAAYRRYLEANATGSGRALAENRATQLEIAFDEAPAEE